MAYEEVGGCRGRKRGFFHGECPIHETGRQVIRKTAYYHYALRENSALRVCPFVQIDDVLRPGGPIRVFGIIYEWAQNARLSVLEICRSITGKNLN